MSGNYSMGKRQRDAEKARKKRQRAERREQRRRSGPREIPIASVSDITGDLDAIEQENQQQEEQPRGAKPIPSRLFVGSLSWGTTGDDLREAFEAFGTVTEAVVVHDRDSGKSRGFGFVTFEDRKDAARAVEELNGGELDGREIVVKLANERKR